MSRRLVALADASVEHPWATVRYLRRSVANRSIPFHKVAGKIWFDVADLDAHEEAGRREPMARRDTGSAANRSRRHSAISTYLPPTKTGRARAG